MIVAYREAMLGRGQPGEPRITPDTRIGRDKFSRRTELGRRGWI